MRFSNAFLDELRARISISEIVGAKLLWDRKKSQPARGDFWARCPFHQEKSSSFHVLEGKGIFYCFGCQAKGGALEFVMKTENLSFPEAVERLATHAGMPLPARDPRAEAQREAQSGLVELNEAAIRFHRSQLHGAAGRAALDYLRRRGLTPQTIETFELGYAPAAGSALAQHLRQGGASAKDLETAGLCAAREDGSLYDRMRDRVIFPIRDARGRAIAFGGRALSAEAKAKYLNSPETPLFHKGEVLFNLARARAAPREADLVVVEGYMDAISLHQAGLPKIVAPLGTALTESHLKTLWRIADEPILLLDGDAAGQRAADRAADLALPLLTAGKSLRFASPPAGRDPDDLAREGGAAAVQAVLRTAEPLISRLWRRETEARPLDTPERRAAFDSRLRELLGLIRESDVRAHYTAAIRERRAALFAPAGRAETQGGGFAGGARRTDFGGRRAASGAGGFGGFKRGGGWEAPIQTVNSTRESRLQQDVGSFARGALEAFILLCCLRRPALIERFESDLWNWAFDSERLDLIRDALLSSAAARIARGETPTEGDLRADLRHRFGEDPEPLLGARLTAQAPSGALRAEAPEAEAEAEMEKAFSALASFLQARAPSAPPQEDPDFEARIARGHAAALAAVGGRADGSETDRACADLDAAIASARAAKAAKRRR
ncbi:DNA primase [Neomegalonema perideroedes]|uniref:DNA primase n=1 Tax=Neomegalonema perideroedes TaxID=217219 RepID=UPI00036671A0|nr:DNA primase [Neomegalonema perideroedes]